MADGFDRQDRRNVRALIRLRAREARAERAVHVAALRLESSTAARDRVRLLIAEVEQHRHHRAAARRRARDMGAREAFLRARVLGGDVKQ